jgi:hypothetical protein
MESLANHGLCDYSIRWRGRVGSSCAAEDTLLPLNLSTARTLNCYAHSDLYRNTRGGKPGNYVAA